MKLHRKLAKLARRETYRRGWRRAQRSVFRLPLGPVLAGLDQNRLAEIQKRYAGEKYADVDQWLRVNRERVQDLKLHRSPPRRVLDLVYANVRLALPDRVKRLLNDLDVVSTLAGLDVGRIGRQAGIQPVLNRLGVGTQLFGF